MNYSDPSLKAVMPGRDEEAATLGAPYFIFFSRNAVVRPQAILALSA
jgi:hypothetical protein